MEVGILSERRVQEVGVEWGCIGSSNRTRQHSMTSPFYLSVCLKKISTQATQEVPRPPGESRTLGERCWGWEKGISV